MSRRNSGGRNLKQICSARAIGPAIISQFEAHFVKFTFLKLTKVAIAEKLHCRLMPTSDEKARQITKINSLPQPQLTPQIICLHTHYCQLRLETHIHGMLKRCHL